MACCKLEVLCSVLYVSGCFNLHWGVQQMVNGIVRKKIFLEDSLLCSCRATDTVLVMQGNASAGERARNTGAQANELVESALGYIARENVLPEHPPSGDPPL